MYFATVAAAAWLATSTPASTQTPAANPSPTTTPAPATAPPPLALSGDAAAKHAKRTACLKEAKTKKLVGADKTTFLRTCIAAP